MKQKLVIILALLVALTGCEYVSEDITSKAGALMDKGDHFTQKELGPTIDEHFGEKIKFAYRLIDESVIDCTYGTCPPIESTGFYIDTECFFCEQSSEVYINENKIVAHTSPMHWSDYMGSCGDKHRFGYPEEFEIIESTSTRIKAKGTGRGSHIRVGEGCKDEFNYTFDSHETWVFTTEPFDVKVSVTTLGGSDGFIAPATNYGPNYVERYSDTKLQVACDSMDGFKVRPWVVLTKINDADASESQGAIRSKKGSNEYYQNPDTFSFTSRYNAEYKIKGICQVYGKNGAILHTAEDSKEYTFSVTDSNQGDFDMSILN